jgi:hypothetical protein
VFDAYHSHHRSTRQKEDSLIPRAVAFLAAGGSATWVSRWTVGSVTPHDPADVVVLVATVAALTLGAWWLADVATWRSALRRGGSVRFTLPGSRRLAQMLLLVSLSSSCVAGATDGPAMVLIGEAVENPTEPSSTTFTIAPSTTVTEDPLALTSIQQEIVRSSDATDSDATAPIAPPAAAEPAPNEDLDELRGSVPAHQVIVKEGDNLWSLAAEALERHGPPGPSSSVVAEYWRTVVAGNQVRSGNPDLIVPGEPIDLPAHEFSP